MADRRDPARNELLRQVEAVARECRATRRSRALLAFAWASFLVSLSLTGLLVVLPSVVFPAAMAYGFWVVAELIAFWTYLLKPLRNPITTEQVALFIDEHHPELENRIITAVQWEGEHAPSESDWMMRRFLAEALPKVSRVSIRDVAARRFWQREGLAATCMIASTMILALLSSGLWFPNLKWNLDGSGSLALGPGFTVEPGDVRVRQGDNIMVWVRGLERHEKVSLRWQEGGGAWNSATASWSPTEDVSFFEFTSIQVPIQYQVVSGRAQSPVFHITPWLPAETSAINLTYHFPEYLQRPPSEAPNSGHITAIEGTRVAMDVHTNRAVGRAEMVFADGTRNALERRDELRWKTELALAKSGSYHIELFDEDGTRGEYQPEYSIRVQRDMPPEVKVAFPRGDGMVTLLEEVPFEFSVTDDFGFHEYGIEYQVADQDPVRVALTESLEGETKARGDHLLPLEDISLEVGDLITWTVWARDAKPDRRDDELRGDPFFLEIRPFEVTFREAVTNAGGQGMPGGGELLQRQREVIIATWDLRRDLGYLDTEEFAERRDVIRDNQSALRDLASQALASGGPQAGQLGQVIREMTTAIEALEAAELPGTTGSLTEATTAEQRAYQLLLKMETYDIQVQQQMNQGGGGQGEQNRFDVNELELNRNRNFYEEEQSTQSQDAAVDELAQSLKELARRQKLVEEEIAKLISEMQKAKTDAEREKLRRRLEKLEEEMRRNLEELDESQQQMASGGMENEQRQQAQDALREAREQMNETLEDIQEERLQQARASSSRAAEALQNLEEQMWQLSSGSVAQRMEQLQESMQELREQQEEIAAEVAELQEEHASPSFEGQEDMAETREDLQARKQQLAEDFVELMNQAGELEQRSRDSQELLSRNLGDWVRQTARDGILEDIESAQPLVQYGAWDAAKSEEEKIARKMDAASEELEKVAESLVEDEVSGMQLALERLEELIQEAEELRGGRSEEDDAESAEGGGGEPREDGQPGPSEQSGEEDGAGNGEEREGQSESGRAPGEESGEGSEPGESQPGQMPGVGEGEGASQRMARAPEQGEGESEGGQQRREDAARTGQVDGANGRNGGTPSPEIGERLEAFIEEDYAEWLEQLREAESMLPRDAEVRRDIGRVRESIEGWRETWRDRALAPRYDLFVKMADEPLREAADRLQREIEDALGDEEFVLVDEGDVPHKYRALVADYFKNLSDGEGDR